MGRSHGDDVTRMAAVDDLVSIDPDPKTIWVDSDGADDMLAGFHGFDDNFHLRSPFGQAIGGALAVVEATETSGDPVGPPAWQPVVLDVEPAPDPDGVSPAVDLGDLAFDFSSEPLEHGRTINAGTYGNTEQASNSPEFFVNMVYPLGNRQVDPATLQEHLIRGNTYEIRWRSHDRAAAGTVQIDLCHGTCKGVNPDVKLMIAAAAPDAGSFLWSVPNDLVVADDDDYVIGIRRAGVDAQDLIVGESRRLFTIGEPDLVPPSVQTASPIVIDRNRSTNALVSDITLTFTENLDALTANNPVNYSIEPAVPFTVNHSPGTTADKTSSVTISFTAGPLAAGDYRLTVSDAIQDTAGLSLDEDEDRVADGDYVRDFSIDFSNPTVTIAGVAPDPRNQPVSEISITFSEAVAGFGLADLRLTRDGGPNLLNGSQTLVTLDNGVTWTLGSIASLTLDEGDYQLELIAADSRIRDLAGNPLLAEDVIGWTMDTTPPRVSVEQVDPDLRSATLGSLDVMFSEADSGFTLNDLERKRDDVNLPLAGALLNTGDGGLTWTLSGLSSLTDQNGIYRLDVLASRAIRDAAGNPLGAAAREIWTFHRDPPVAAIGPVSPNPRNSPVDEIVVSFTTPVVNFDVWELSSTRDGGSNLLSGYEPLTTLDGMHWRLAGLAPLTGTEGDYTLTLLPGDIQGVAGNALAAGTSETWRTDQQAPTVMIAGVSPNPRNTAVSEIQFTFSEPVVGLAVANLTLSGLRLVRDGGANRITGNESLSVTGNVWTLAGLNDLTGDVGNYELSLLARDSLIRDASSNMLLAGSFEVWQVVAESDFGDAPDSFGTTRASDGARHVATGPLLGTTRDSELDAAPPLDGTGDDASDTGSADDEDGVIVVTTIVATRGSATTASLAVTASALGKLDAWIDFNRDGTWTIDEQIFVMEDVVAGVNLLSVTVPAGSVPGDAFARFRLSSAGGLNPTGATDDGEVEDYVVSILDGDDASGVPVIVELAETGTIDVLADGSNVVVRSGNIDLFRAPGAVLSVVHLIGTSGDDTLNIANLSAAFAGSIVGDAGPGRDTLRLTSGGQELDLTNITDDDVQGIETIDITGSGANTLTLDVQEVENISATTDDLTVIANGDDTVNFGGGWSLTGSLVDAGVFFRVLEQGDVRLLLSGPHNWQNPIDRHDVNNDGTSPALQADILPLINEINHPTVIDEFGKLADAATSFIRFYDINGDGFLTAGDILVQINEANRQVGGGGESAPVRDAVEEPAPVFVRIVGRPVAAAAMSGVRMMRAARPAAPALPDLATLVRVDERPVATDLAFPRATTVRGYVLDLDTLAGEDELYELVELELDAFRER